MGFFDFFKRKGSSDSSQSIPRKAPPVSAPIPSTPPEKPHSDHQVQDFIPEAGTGGASISEVGETEATAHSKGMKSLRDKTVPQSSLQQLVTRNSVAFQWVDRLKRDPWRGDYELTSQTENLADKVRQFCDYLDFPEVMSRAFVYSMVSGCGLIYMDIVKLNDLETKADPITSRTWVVGTPKEGEETRYDFRKVIRKIVPLSGRQIDKFEYDDNGEIEYFYIYKKGYSGTSEKIHRDRIIHIPNWLLSNNPRGISALTPLYDGLTDLENANIALIESFIKASTGIMALELPTDHAPMDGQFDDNVTEADWKWAQDEFKDIDAMKNLVHPRDWKINVHNMNKGVNPEPYMDNIFKNLSAGSRIAKVLMTGAEQGQLTGSEYVVKEYHALVKDWRIQLERHWYIFIERWQEWGLFEKGSITISWGPIDQPTQKEMAELQKERANALYLFANANGKMKDLGWILQAWNNSLYWIKVSRDEEVIGIEIPFELNVEKLENFVPEKDLLENVTQVYPSEYSPAPPQAPPKDPEGEGAQGPGEPPNDSQGQANGWERAYIVDMLRRFNITDKVRLTIEEKAVLNKKFDIQELLDSLISEYDPQLRIGILDYVKNFLDDFEKASKKAGFYTDQYLQDQDPELLRVIMEEMIGWTGDGAPIDNVIKEGMDEGMKEGWDMGKITAGFLPDWKPGNPWAAEYFFNHAPSLAQGIKTDVTSQMVYAMQAGLATGKNYQDVYKLIKGAGGKYTKDSVGKVVHRMMHGALNSARVEAWKDEGTVSKEKPLVWRTQGDVIVRPEHQLLEGTIWDPDEGPEVMAGEWNCRCWFEPSLAIERLRGRPLTKQEMGAEKPVWEVEF